MSELPWAVWDATTANLLGDFATEEAARAFIEEIRPLGRFGPAGHDLQAIHLDADGRPTPSREETA